MVRLDGKDGALEKHTAYMDQFILVRLVELQAVMNEYLIQYLCAHLSTKQYMANLLYRRRTHFGNHAAPPSTWGNKVYVYYVVITFYNLWKEKILKF